MVKFSCCARSPKFIIFLFIATSLIIFTDRGVLSSIITYLESHSYSGLGLSSLESGFLGSSFLLGFMLAGPLFAYFSQTVHPLFLIALGQTLWCGAIIFTGLSANFPMLLCARAISGVGEASLVLAPPCILDLAPASTRAIWIGLYLCTIPIGYAFGFVLGPQVTVLTGAWFSVFFLEVLLMIPIIVCYVCVYKDPKLYAKSEKEGSLELKKMVWMLVQNKSFMIIALGYGASQFTFGGMSFWVF
jgi:MFS transporter, Spinster family, sphingosine-1-phosphate transporter